MAARIATGSYLTKRIADSNTISKNDPIKEYAVDDNHGNVDLSAYIKKKKTIAGEIVGSEGSTGSTKPLQEHHFATNKSKKYTSQFENIANKYNLDLDGAWNKELMPHQGRHPNAYHDYVLDNMQKFDKIAQGDQTKFLKLYDQMKQKIISNPDMLYKKYWINQQEMSE